MTNVLKHCNKLWGMTLKKEGSKEGSCPIGTAIPGTITFISFVFLILADRARWTEYVVVVSILADRAS